MKIINLNYGCFIVVYPFYFLFCFSESTTVNVGGIDCQLISLNNTVIVCQTGEHNGSAKVPVEVTVENNGKASGVSILFVIDVKKS